MCGGVVIRKKASRDSRIAQLGVRLSACASAVVPERGEAMTKIGSGQIPLEREVGVEVLGRHRRDRRVGARNVPS